VQADSYNALRRQPYGAIAAHQYKNRFQSDSCFLWTCQNQMKPSNRAGTKVLAAAEEKRTLRLLVQPKSHKHSLGKLAQLATIPGFCTGEKRLWWGVQRRLVEG